MLRSLLLYSFFVFILILNYVSFSESWTGRIVFEDNFDGVSLDTNKWEYQEGCSDIYGARNLQCYVRNNVQVQNGILTITAKRENREDKEYTSGRIRQRGEGFAYGAYVVRARLARGDHLWPALWMLPINNECRYEEIDIAEYRGQLSESRSLEQAGHWGRTWNALTSRGEKINTGFDLSTDYHEYAILWLENKLEWYIDNQKYYEVGLNERFWTSDPNKIPCRGPAHPFTENSNFIFNVAVGGPFFDNFPVFNPNTWTKPTLDIDWVRIYQE